MTSGSARKACKLFVTTLVSVALHSVVLGDFKSEKPDVVCKYLEQEGFKTEGYKVLDGEDYFAASPYKTIGKGQPPSNLAYYVEGKKTAVNRVYLTLNVNNLKEATKLKSELVKASESLSKKATGDSLPKEVRQALTAAKAGEWKANGHTFKVEKVQFTGTIKGYSLTCKIE